MANHIAGYEWTVDTAATLITSPDVICIKHMEWHPNAADDDLIIYDGDGHVIWRVRAKAGAPNHETYGIETFPITPNKEGFISYRGFVINTIDGGTLYIHIA